MTNINCRLFGAATITEDGKDVFIPTGKLSGLFYYILLKKIVSRDEVAGIFWPMSNEERARISLRNALHKIRRSFNEEIILSPNKSTLMLNESLNFTIDVEEFERDPFENLHLYTGDFLRGFYVKEAVDFEYWVMELRAYYKEKFINTAQKRIVENFNNKHFKDLENDINNLLAVDNFNELAYLYLMKLYKLRGRYDKIVNDYYNLQRLMFDDLGIGPSDEIEAAYADAIREINKNQNVEIDDKVMEFYSRDYELNILQKNLDDYYGGKDGKSILITGESGIGKTVLKKKLLSKNRDRFLIFEARCYSVEKNFSYSPWMKIISLIENEFAKKNSKKPYIWNEVIKNLFFDVAKNNQPFKQIFENRENFNINLVYNSIYSALLTLSTNKKIIIVLEDIQWADLFSIKLLINLILHSNENVLFLMTKSNESDEKVDRLLYTLNDVNKLIKIDLKRFNKRDVAIIVRKSLEDKDVPEEVISNIYHRSKGNAFFLKEYIELYKKNRSENYISAKMYNVLQEKFSALSENEIEILKILSLFYGDVNIGTLLKIVDLKAFEVVKSLNYLVKMNVLEEKKSKDQIMIQFVHSAYKDFIYHELNEGERQIIHNEIGNILERELILNSKDITNYIRLKHHFSKANKRVKALKYEVYILNYYLNFSHELFPNLDDYDLGRQVKLYIKNDKALQWIDAIEKEILFVKNSDENYDRGEIYEIEQLFLYSKGRYLIRGGNYSEGIRVMNRVINLSIGLKDRQTELFGHKQMTIYGIQINNTSIMLKHILAGIKVAKKMGSNLEIGILYRLYGLYYLMQGDFKAAEKLFRTSIKLFIGASGIGNGNSISLAANYNYIGEIRGAEQKYDQAMEYYQKAIDLCREIEPSCLSIFYINAGKTCFLMKDNQGMKTYLLRSKKIVEQFDSYWKTSVLDAFMALTAFFDGDYLKSEQYLKDAVAEVKTINNPRDIGMVYFVETIIKAIIEKEEVENFESLGEFLKESSEFYYYKAMKYLDANRDRGEIEYLKEHIIL